MDFNIESIKRKMLIKYPFFGSVVANVDYKENTNIPTAGTDGKTIYYNSDFLKGLDQDEQTFIFAHEVCHIAFDHIRRSESKNPEVWNIATDAVINQFLKHDGLKLVEGSIDMAEALNYDAEELYDKLLKEKQQNQEQEGQGNQQNQNGNQSQEQNSESQNEKQSQEQESSQQGSSPSEQGRQDQEQSAKDDSQKQNEQEKGEGSSSAESSNSLEENHDVGHDTHSMWKDAVKKQKEKQSDEQKTEEQIKKEETLQQEIDKISKMGEQRAFDKNLKDKKQELEALKEALAKQAMGAGTSTNEEQRIINDIGKSKPIIDWRYFLREAIQYEVDWSYKNAYIEDGVVSANLEEQPMPETEIVLDTSGSIDEILLKNFLRECKNILQYSKIKVGCFDTEFYGFYEIRTEEDIENMEFVGGGGTDFNVAVRAFTRRVENKIIFTDGDASMPDIPMDAIWIVFGYIEINPKGGKVIQITGEQLDKLFSYKLSLSKKKN